MNICIAAARHTEFLKQWDHHLPAGGGHAQAFIALLLVHRAVQIELQPAGRVHKEVSALDDQRQPQQPDARQGARAVEPGGHGINVDVGQALLRRPQRL